MRLKRKTNKENKKNKKTKQTTSNKSDALTTQPVFPKDFHKSFTCFYIKNLLTKHEPSILWNNVFSMSHFLVEYDQDLRSQQYLTYLENSLIVLP